MSGLAESDPSMRMSVETRGGKDCGSIVPRNKHSGTKLLYCYFLLAPESLGDTYDTRMHQQ